MEFKIFSVIVGNAACPAACPFCVSSEHISKENMVAPEVNWRNFKIGANLANRHGVDTVVLTSRGEPTLFPEQITEYLQNLQEFRFPFIELQTNGIVLQKGMKKNRKYLEEWYSLGLTTVALSIVSYDPYKNAEIYLDSKSTYINLPELISTLHAIGLSVRLACVCCRGITDSSEEVGKFLKFAKDNKVEQVMLRPVNDEFRRQSAMEWINENRLSYEQKENIREYLDTAGTKLLDLERIGAVYDVDGQNVCFSVPMSKNLRDTDPDKGRQLIFFQDGHLKYEWEEEGVLL